MKSSARQYSDISNNELAFEGYGKTHEMDDDLDTGSKLLEGIDSAINVKFCWIW